VSCTLMLTAVSPWPGSALQSFVERVEPPTRFVLEGVGPAALAALMACSVVAVLASLTGQRRGRSALARLSMGLLGILAVLASAAVIGARALDTAAVGLLVLGVTDLLGSVRGRRAIPAWIVAVASPAALYWAGTRRVDGGGTLELEWLGSPFSGDPSATTAFLALVIPLFLPGALGGVWAGLSCGPRAASGSRLAYGLTAVVRPLAYGVLAAKTLAGTDELLRIGVAVVWVMPLVALFQRCAAHRLSSLAYAAFWAILAGQGAATERSADAFAIGLLGYGLPITGLALVLALVRGEQAAHPGLAPDGVGRLFPLTFWLSLLLAAGAAGFPLLGAFHGRVQSVGALEWNGEGPTALFVALSAAPLFAMVALPWIHSVFLTRNVHAGASVPQRQREPRIFLVGVALAAAGCLILGLLPGLFGFLLPFGDLAPQGVPSPLGQAQLLFAAAWVASFSKGRMYPSKPALSSTP
jgi:hypothetical protein